jgi:hypothetical protein
MSERGEYQLPYSSDALLAQFLIGVYQNFTQMIVELDT